MMLHVTTTLQKDILILWNRVEKQG